MESILKDFTPEEYHKMRERLEYDYEICKELFVSHNALSVWKRKHNIKVGRSGNRKPNMPDDERIAIIKKMLNKNVDFHVIADAVDLKKSSLQAFMVKKGIVKKRVRNTMPDSERIPIIKKMLADGVKREEIAHVVGFTRRESLQEYMRMKRKEGITF